MPPSRSGGKKPKVENRRYLRPDEAHRLIESPRGPGPAPANERRDHPHVRAAAMLFHQGQRSRKLASFAGCTLATFKRR